jgi:hypothetical protein
MKFNFSDCNGEDPGYDVEAELVPEANTSIMELYPGPTPWWIVFIDNHEYFKHCTHNFAVYPREDTLLNERYTGRLYYEPIPVRCPHQGGSGIVSGILSGMEVFFGEDVDLDIVGVECSSSTAVYGEVLDVNVTVQNNRNYPVTLDYSADETFLMFKMGQADVNDSFIVTYPKDSELEGAATETFTFSVRPRCEAPPGIVTIDPVVCYFDDFADGEGSVRLSGRKVGSAYPELLTVSFEVLCPGACIDSDTDGFYDFEDNCPQAFNPLQTDADSDGTGNACDNCVSIYNPDQNDTDADGIGGVCDNCPQVFNPDQNDNDVLQMDPLEGIISFWKFEDGEGTTANDSANGNNATVYGATWTGNGRVGDALSFDGHNDYVRVSSPSGLDFDMSNAITIEAWFQLAGHYDFDGIVSINEVGCCAYRIMVTTDLHPFYNPGSHTDVTIGSFTFGLERWYHYAIVIQAGANAVVYVDGHEIYSSALGVPSILPPGNDIFIGTGEEPGVHPTQGIIDEVAIYDRALSSDEIRFHYERLRCRVSASDMWRRVMG